MYSCPVCPRRPLSLFLPLQVTGLLTQGKGDDEEWVTSFELSYSLDAYHWHFARDIYNNKKVSVYSLIVGFVCIVAPRAAAPDPPPVIRTRTRTDAPQGCCPGEGEAALPG